MLRNIAVLVLAAVSAVCADVPWKPGSVVTVPGIYPNNVFAGPFAVTPTGNVYLANALVSAPTQTIGSNSAFSLYVSALDSTGKLLYALRIESSDWPAAISADAAGNLYIAGYASDSGFFTTPHAYSSVFAADNSAWVCKLSPSGAPVFCTYLGWIQLAIQSIASDAAGNVYVMAGNGSGAPPGAQELLLKLSSDGSQLLWTASFASNFSGNFFMAVDASGTAYVPATGPGGQNAIAVFSPSGTALGYLAADAGDSVAAIALDGSGGVYVAGQTATFNTFVARYAAGSRVYKTLLPNTGQNIQPVLAVDNSGVATLAGQYSSNPGFNGLPGGNFLEHQPTATCTAAGGAVMVRVDPNGAISQSTYLGIDMHPSAAAVSANGGYLAGAGSDSNLALVALVPDVTGASVTTIGCVANSADLDPGAVAPGEIVSVFGDGLGPATPTLWELSSSSQIASALSGVEVTFDNIPSPLLYVQDSQINAIAPFEIAGKTSTQMCAVYNDASHCITLPVAAVSPGIFCSPPGSAAAMNQDGTVNSTANPAKRGSVISLYVTGLGMMEPVPADGAIVQLPLPELTNPVQVFFYYVASWDAQPEAAEVLYAGPTPFELAGLYQINVRVPTTADNIGEVYVQVTLPNGTTVQSPPVSVAID